MLEWFLDIVTQFCIWLDNIIYWFIAVVYDLLMRIADTTFFNKDIFREFSTRIYSLLGIFMLFKLTFSLITYTINPDDLTEKSKGVQNIIVRILVTLILLIITPTIFTRARELQKIILDNGVLENVILGIGSSGDGNVADPNNVAGIGNSKTTAGARMSFVLLSAFVKPNAVLFPNCVSGMYLNSVVNQLCLSDLKEAKTRDGEVSIGDYVESAWNNKDVSLLLDMNVIGAKNNSNQNYMDYRYIISSVAGAFVVYIFVVFCVDIAIRSIRLGFLELIAPIPILGNIDPKASKDGTFSKWWKIVLNTYLDLFLRLAAIYFAIFIFDNIDLVTGSSGNGESDFIVKVFIILGALLFAKQLPELLKEFFPGMGKGSFELSWRKKMEAIPGIGKGIGALPAGLAAATGAGLGAFGANMLAKKGNIFSGLAGAASAMGRGSMAALSGKKAGEVYKSAYGGATAARERRITARESGATMHGTAAARVQRLVGAKTAADRIKLQQDEYKGFVDKAKGIFDLAGGEMMKSKYDNLRFKDQMGGNISMADFKIEKSRLEALKNVNTSGWSQGEINKHLEDINWLEGYIGKTEKNAQQAFITEVMKGKSGQFANVSEMGEITAQITSQMDSLNRLTQNSTDQFIRQQNVNNGVELKKAMDAVNTANIELENSAKTAEARANAEAAKPIGGSGGGGSKK